MNRLLCGSALALAAITPLSAALAQDAGDAENEITVDAPLLHPAAGLMADHMHDGGEFMVGVRYKHASYSGANRSGRDEISDADILAAGYTTRATAMDMNMVMLDLMYAPNDKVTLMVMPMYMWHRMTMVGIDPMAGMGGMGGHAGHMMLGYGDTHSHGSEGFGDTFVSASYRLARKPGFGAHATLGVWVPTGAVDLKNPDGSYVHYGMQPGGGTWDLEPSVTVNGHEGAFGWGAQAAYRWKTEKENESGFAFGDTFRATGWTSYRVAADVGATFRLEYRSEGPVEGHYNAGHNHAAPPDRQANYGGDMVTAGLGVNWALPVGGISPPQIGAEISVPLLQDLNGIQVPQDWKLAVNLSKTF